MKIISIIFKKMKIKEKDKRENRYKLTKKGILRIIKITFAKISYGGKTPAEQRKS